jgi:hypothetical protein
MQSKNKSNKSNESSEPEKIKPLKKNLQYRSHQKEELVSLNVDLKD